jgi:hypothetical protein
VISIGAGNHGIRKVGTGVVGIQYGVIPMWAEQLSTWTGEARGEIGKIPIRKIIIRMHKGMLWMTLSMRKIFKM